MTAHWRPAYVAIGSNLQSPLRQVHEAFRRLEGLPIVRSLSRSRLYSALPLGPQNQPAFINAAAGFVTQSSPRELLEQLLAIERAMGRIRAERWGPRIVDLDLLWMAGCLVDEPGLRVPHPGVASRNFVLYPLADLAPTIRIPSSGSGDDSGSSVIALLRKAGDAGISLLN